MYGRTIIFDGAIYPAKFKEASIDLAFGASGTAYCNFVVSTYGGKDKDKINHRCVAFGDLAEHIAESCKPGDEVIVVGSMESNNYTPEGGDDDDKRYGNQVLVDMVGLSLRWDTAKSNKMWTDKPGEAKAETGKKKDKKGKKKKSSPDEAPFSGASS